MNDNALFINIIAVISAGMTLQSASVGIKQAYQTTVQSTPSAPTLFLHKLGDIRLGSPARKDTFANGVMTHSETEVIETSFQLDCLVTLDPANLVQLTASDYLKAAARTLQSEISIANLQANGIGIYRIRPITTTYFRDDSGAYEASPMFEFTVTHSDVISYVINSTTQLVPAITTVTGVIPNAY